MPRLGMKRSGASSETTKGFGARTCFVEHFQKWSGRHRDVSEVAELIVDGTSAHLPPASGNRKATVE